MPNKCTKCGKLHDDDANYLLTTGCNACGGRFFFFVREGYVPEVEEEVSHITKKEMKEIERDIRSILPVRMREKKDLVTKDNEVKAGEAKKEEKQEEETVVLDIEAIRVIKPGKYRINVETLFNQKPIVVKVGTGKYEIDFSVLAEKFVAKK
jgi:predicted  nucleic acid-binding Zn-ribbon protein